MNPPPPRPPEDFRFLATVLDLDFRLLVFLGLDDFRRVGFALRLFNATNLRVAAFCFAVLRFLATKIVLRSYLYFRLPVGRKFAQALIPQILESQPAYLQRHLTARSLDLVREKPLPQV